MVFLTTTIDMFLLFRMVFNYPVI